MTLYMLAAAFFLFPPKKAKQKISKQKAIVNLQDF